MNINSASTEDEQKKANEYKKLRNYYIKMFQKIDLIHFNSSITKSIYEDYFELPENKVVTISHKNIRTRHKSVENKKK